MSYITADRIGEIVNGAGLGSMTLAGAIDPSYKPFSSCCTDGDTFPGELVEVNAVGNPTGRWETGEYTWRTGGIIERTTVLESSNANQPVAFTDITKHLYLAVVAKSQVFAKVALQELVVPVTSDGAMTVSLPTINPALGVDVFINGIQQRRSEFEATPTLLTLPATLNLIAGDVVSAQYRILT